MRRTRAARIGGIVALLAITVAGVALLSEVTEPADATTTRETHDSQARARGSRANQGSDASIALAPDGGVSVRRCGRVRVLDYDGQPQRAEIESRGRDANGYGPWGRGTTDDDGEIELCTELEGCVLVRARAGDEYGESLACGMFTDEVTLVRVAAPATVHGRVLAPDGSPAPDAPIAVAEFFPGAGDGPTHRAGDHSSRYAAGAALTDAEGRFSVRLVGGRIFQVGARTPETTRTWAGPFAGRPGATYETTITLLPAVTLEVVVAHDGAPIEGATLRVNPSRVHGRFPPHTLADGRYVLEGQHPDARFDLSADAPGFVGTLQREVLVGRHTLELVRAVRVTVPVEVEPPLDRCLAAPMLGDRQRGLMRGGAVQIRLSNGTDIAGTSLREARGEVVLDDVPPGPAELSAYAMGSEVRRPIELRGEAMRTPLVRLTANPERGVLRILADEPNISYDVRDAEGQLHMGTGTALAWECHPLDPGRYLVRGDPVEIRAGQVTDLHLEPREEPERRSLYPVRCGAPFETREHEHSLEVTRLSGAADGQVLPGDRIVDIEGDPEASLPYRLAGPPGSSVRVLVERPDESRVWVVIARERCER